jgi:hypothetical protein
MPCPLYIATTYYSRELGTPLLALQEARELVYRYLYAFNRPARPANLPDTQQCVREQEFYDRLPSSPISLWQPRQPNENVDPKLLLHGRHWCDQEELV